MEKIHIKEVMKEVKYCESEENMWRADFIKEIVNVKYKSMVLLNDENEEMFDNEDLDDIIDYLCSS